MQQKNQREINWHQQNPLLVNSGRKEKERLRRWIFDDLLPHKQKQKLPISLTFRGDLWASCNTAAKYRRQVKKQGLSRHIMVRIIRLRGISLFLSIRKVSCCFSWWVQREMQSNAQQSASLPWLNEITDFRMEGHHIARLSSEMEMSVNTHQVKRWQVLPNAIAGNEQQ